MANRSKVVVVGGGIIGLTTALAFLQEEQGRYEVEIRAEKFEDITSFVAGAVWGPVGLPPMDNALLYKWCKKSIEWLYNEIEEYGTGAHSGINLVSGYDVTTESNDTEFASPIWASLTRNFRVLNEGERKQIHPKAAHGIGYSVPLLDPATFIPRIRARIKSLGGTFVIEKVRNLHEIKADIVVNCTGLAARELANDPNVMPLRGQTVRVRHEKIREFSTICDGEDTTYILPRPGGVIVLGGTKQLNNWSTESDANDVARIVRDASRYNPHVKDATLVGTFAGLRPYRIGGPRVEAEPSRTRSGALLLHNYGHGGSGHSIQWGCAQDIVHLAKEHEQSTLVRSKM